MKKRLLYGALLMLILSSCSVRDYGASPDFAARDDLLGTMSVISIYEKVSGRVLDEAFARVEEIDGKMSRTNPESEVNALNHAGGQWMELSGETVSLIAEAKDFSGLSGGAFDISVEPVVRLWDITGANPGVPDEAEIKEALSLVDYRKIEIDPDAGRIRLEQGMSVDLGAIAKGYACDEAVRVLERYGVKRAILDFGGNIYALGEKEDGLPWRIGVKNPIIGEEGIIGTLRVRNKAVVTSGAYERYFTENGNTYHHIIDPVTGYPSASGVLSVTVICDNSAKADALSTACFVMGSDEGLALLESLDGVDGLYICDDFTVRMTDGAVDLFSLEDGRFDLVEGEP